APIRLRLVVRLTPAPFPSSAPTSTSDDSLHPPASARKPAPGAMLRAALAEHRSPSRVFTASEGRYPGAAISPTRSLALLALVVLASLPSGALAQRGSALGSPTGEPASAPTPPPPPQQSAEQVLSDSGAAEPPAEGAQPEAQESEPGTEAPEAATAGE